MSEQEMNPGEATVVADLPPTDSEDAAWVTLATPLSVAALTAFCKEDVERLLRINPFIEFNQWEEREDGRYRYSFKNSSQDNPVELDLELQVEYESDGLTLHYSSGLKQSTQFKIEEDPHGSRMIIIENYAHHSEEERKARIDEVDRSLTTWAKDLQLYLIRWNRWSRIAPWSWYMRRIWQPMKPKGRRITYMLLWISLVEVSLIALGVSLYLAEYS